MKLDAFMKANDLDDAGMASLIGDCSEGAVKKWRYRERTPRPAQMQRIFTATNGAVTPNDFMDGAPSDVEPVQQGAAA